MPHSTKLPSHTNALASIKCINKSKSEIGSDKQSPF